MFKKVFICSSILFLLTCARKEEGRKFLHDYPNDSIIRINHIQAKGTHNSYHIEDPTTSKSIPEYRYTHKPLNEQLDAGVRQIELDIHFIEGEGLKVFHVPYIDTLSTCGLFTDCLKIVKTWSDEHPEHHPILIFIEPKDDIDEIKLDDKYSVVESDILSVFPRGRIITPDDVRGDYPTLREAILNTGWPTLGETRGKVFFHVNDSGSFRDSYLSAYPDLKGALMFIDSTPEDSFAGIMPINNPVNDFDRIQSAVLQGFIVRTMAGNCCDEAITKDYSRINSALESGAHFISTDFPTPDNEYGYSLQIPDGTPSRCNPVSAPDFCTPSDIEQIGIISE